MDKIAWVLLPLVALLAWVGWRVATGRRPSRLSLNVVSSVLLLGYLAATAGLGIFWVANQQLPVFDWHYLFGYATVLLVVVHLAFNFRVVWQHWRRARRRPAGHAPAVSASAATGRPPGDGAGAVAGPPLMRRPVSGALLALGFAASTGGAFWLGLRHGRTEITLGGQAGGGAAGTANGTSAGTSAGPSARADAWAVVLAFHEFSSHSRLGVFRRAPATQWGLAPPPFLPLPAGAAWRALPPPWRSRAQRPAAVARDAAALGTLLWHGAGVSLERGGIAFRAAPSSGALFSTELYLLSPGLGGIAPGVHRYTAERHGLVRHAGAAPPLPAGAWAAVVATAVFRRSGHKYGDRTYRYVTCDLGHALENLRTAAAALGWQATLLPAFDEARLAAALGLADEEEEGVLAVLLLHGADEDVAPAAAVAPPAPDTIDARGASGSAGTAGATGAEPGRWHPAPLPQAAALGVTAAVHRATSLRAGWATAGALPPAWPRGQTTHHQPGLPRHARAAPAPATLAAAAAAAATDADAAAAPVPAGPSPLAPPSSGGDTQTLRLPPLPAPADDLLALMARRRSRRRYADRALPLAALARLLAAAAAAPVLSPALRLAVITPAVQGLAPRAWHLEPAAQQLLAAATEATPPATPQDLRRRLRSAGLGQDVVGDAAAVLLLAAERALIEHDPLGPARAYRHALVEAGLAGERVYLAAEALGLGACAVGAYYDDETAALAGWNPAQAWVLHLVCIGVPG